MNTCVKKNVIEESGYLRKGQGAPYGIYGVDLWSGTVSTRPGPVATSTVPSLDCSSLKNLVRNTIEKVLRSSINRTGIVDR